MTPPLLIIDAFTDEAFEGNPAAVCLLDAPAPEAWMQRLAAEMNLSETAFVAPSATGGGFALRWFTPATEVDLCGHATLAAAHALWDTCRLQAHETARFHTRSGVLEAERDGEWIAMDLPAYTMREATLSDDALRGLGATPVRIMHDGSKHYVELESERAVRELAPDLAAIRRITDSHGVVVTALSDDQGSDFVSRFFAGPVGIDEDPVCGSAHCALAPYWGERLGKSEMLARQISPRGGALRVRVKGERVEVAGQAVTVVRGRLSDSAIPTAHARPAHRPTTR